MKKIFFLLLLMSYSSCLTDKSRGSNPKKCDKDIYDFVFEDFSSEGSEGKILLNKNNLVDKIKFSYATSMNIIDQEFIFFSSKLIEFKHKSNVISIDKFDYIEQDSIIVRNDSIYKSSHFDKNIFNKIVLEVVNKIPCLKKKIDTISN